MMDGTQARAWTWHFDQPPEKIWPALADTARFNEAADLPKHRIVESPQPDGTVVYTGHARFGPFAVSWREHPVEWVTNRRFRHARVFANGPLRALVATLTLTPEGTGTRGEYLLEVTPANLFGRLMLRAGFFRSTEKTFRRLAGEANAYAAGQAEQPFAFRPAALPEEASARLTRLVRQLEAETGKGDLARRLGEFIVAGSEVDLLHLRPLRLARLWHVPEREVIELCLRAVRAGLLTMHWDLLCPNCRGAKVAVASLDRLPIGAHCPTCNIDYARDFARNVELTFQPAAAIRVVPDGEFCLFGPMTTPHVVVQQTLAPGETRDVPADLPFGDYRLRGLHPGGEAAVTWGAGGFPELIADADGVRAGAPAAPGTVRMVNRRDHDLTLLVESRAWVRDALTAHRVTTLQAFRDLFATEALRPGDEVGVGHVTLMFTDLRGSTALYSRIGDARAYHLVREHFAYLAGAVRACDGAVVKTIGDAVMAAFSDPANALRAALDVQRNVARFNREQGLAPDDGVVIKLGLHGGPCIVVTLNERLDYFGSTVNLAARLQGESRGGDIVLSKALAADPAVAVLLRPLAPAAESASVKGFEAPVGFLRVALGAFADIG
ncbi:MAG: SRPBCC family protein [Rhodospirillales bacterium]|nr:SRPBCC family protein [Rhodospirillales bacterium]